MELINLLSQRNFCLVIACIVCVIYNKYVCIWIKKLNIYVCYAYIAFYYIIMSYYIIQLQ